ncbi:YqaJ viral recombinase family protein [Parvularcula flava]|uniref:Exonuclease n=1 Tax=Aquisalinus luteolus TaxID=1566827 RepID=A0A8J3A4Y6_9PROT|nr:lambda exonuclease family protein [Aquisalinus luteolus]NHK29155.1 YqaJ viral recombinase family protein [Aquisalinus luteolus]GGI00137.1 exonuclease [Aquisalinus luteolus]
MEQRTEEWFSARAGKFTASRAGDLMNRNKNGSLPKAYHDLLTTLAVERLTGKCAPTFESAAMRHGNETESEAREAYSFDMGVSVEELAFQAHPDLANVSCSPDGLVGDLGLVEIKCPYSPTKHFEALREDAHAEEYKWQVQHQLLCFPDRQWVDLVSYDNRFPAHLQLAIKRIERDDKMQADLVEAIAIADAAIDEMIAAMQSSEAA